MDVEQKLLEMDRKLDRVVLAVEGDPSDERKPGMRLDVDRLKRTVALQVKLLWLLLTTTVGVLADAAYKHFTSK